MIEVPPLDDGAIVVVVVVVAAGSDDDDDDVVDYHTSHNLLCGAALVTGVRRPIVPTIYHSQQHLITYHNNLKNMYAVGS